MTATPAALARTADLVGLARGGDRRALDQLLRLHRGRAVAVARRVVRDADAAEDVVQDALVAAATHLAGFEGTAAFGTWLYRVTLHHALNHRRAEGRRSRVADRLAVREPREPPVDPGALLDAAAARAAVREAIAALPRLHRTCLVLRDVEGLDYDEIARRTRLPPGTVRSRLHRARARVRALLEADRSGAGVGA